MISGGGGAWSRRVEPTTCYLPQRRVAPLVRQGCAPGGPRYRRAALTEGRTLHPAALEPYASTVQWSRRAIGLKVFLALAELGAAGYAELIEHQAAMGQHLRDQLMGAGWRVVNDTSLPVLCFTHPELEAGGKTVEEVLTAIYRRNRVWLSAVQLGERQLLRACVTSYHTNAADVACLVDELQIAFSLA